MIKNLFLTGFLCFGISAAVITSINVNGSKRIEKQTIVSYLPVKIGDNISNADLDQCLKTLYNTGYFDDVSIAFQNGAMVITIEENPIINRIAYEGNSKIKDDDFKKEIRLRPREVLSPAKIQTAQQRILEIYRRLGRFSAKVDPKIIRLPNNRVDLIFDIEEGPTTYIKKISFIGNKNIPASHLEKAISTKVWRWYRFFSSDDIYDPDRFLNDQQEILKHYADHGYPDARIVSSIAELSTDKTGYYLTFSIDEGQHYNFGTYKVSSSINSIDIQKFSEDIAFDKNDEFSASKVEKTKLKIINRLGDMGYAFIEVEADYQRNPESNTIDVNFFIKEGPKVYIEQIIIKGNDRTHDSVIRRQIRIHEGDAYNTTKIKYAEQSIRDLDYFKEVNLYPEEGSEIDRAKIEVDLEEKRTGSADFGLGYGTLDGPFASISLKQRNFQGTGVTVSSGLRVASKNMGINAGISDPNFLGRDLQGSWDVMAEQSSRLKAYKESTYGTGAGLAYALSEHWWQETNYTIRVERIKGRTNHILSPILQSQAHSATLSEISQTLHYSNLDSRLFPTKGFDLSYLTGFAGVGGNIRYLKHLWSATTYRSIHGDEVVLKIQGSYGIMQKMGKTIRVVDSFSLGYDSLRGFDYRGVGPRDGKTFDALNGTRMWRVSAELKVPLGLPDDWGVNGVLFHDMGCVWKAGQRNQHTLDDKKVRMAYGAGIKWRSPFGPIGFSYAVPYKKSPYDDARRIQLQFSNMF